jgi:hypothetical protein
MSLCPKCGGANDPTSGFCRACGTALPVASAGTSRGAVPPPPPAAANPPAPAVAKKKGNKAVKIVGILVAVFVGLVIFGAIIDSRKNSGKGPTNDPDKTASAQKAPEHSQSRPVGQPTAEQLAKAQQAGLSKDFATGTWLTHRYVTNTYGRVLAGLTDADITLPPDEAIRDSLKASRNSIRNAADQLAYDRMYALLWIDHTASGMTPDKDEQSLYMHYIRSGNGCFIGVMASFEAGHKYAPGLTKDIQDCLRKQAAFKADFDKTHPDDF